MTPGLRHDWTTRTGSRAFTTGCACTRHRVHGPRHKGARPVGCMTWCTWNRGRLFRPQITPGLVCRIFAKVRLAGSTILTDSENILDLRGHEFARSIRTYRAGGCPAIKPWSDGYWHRTTTTTPISSKYRPNPAAPPRSTQGSSA